MAEEAPILLLHGFSNTGACWQAVQARLDRPALAPTLAAADLPGALSQIAAALPAPGTLVGYSQGGRIALHAALDRRVGARIKRLVLIGASPGIEDPRERAARRSQDAALADWIEAHTVAEFADRWAKTPVLADLSPELAARARADRLNNTPAGLAATLRGLGTGALPSLWHSLDRLEIPVTLLAGERDTKFSAIAAQMASRIPDARVVIVPGAGHQVHLQRPDAVAAEVASIPTARATRNG
ncbi:MAG: alpha/beta fold hydrolase [Solirubrobacterales bacterium]|nr:alpha/beta fold hydrolase [Solirubrobacterales bacterium]